MPKKRAKPPQAYIDYVNALACYCRDATFHGEYELSVDFPPGDCPDDKPEDQLQTAAKVTICSVYLQMYITCYSTLYYSWKNKDYKRLGRLILHEVCHAYIKPLQHQWQWDDAKSQTKVHQETVERQTQRIRNTIYYLLPNDWYMPEVIMKAAAKRK